MYCGEYTCKEYGQRKYERSECVTNHFEMQREKHREKRRRTSLAMTKNDASAITALFFGIKALSFVLFHGYGYGRNMMYVCMTICTICGTLDNRP